MRITLQKLWENEWSGEKNQMLAKKFFPTVISFTDYSQFQLPPQIIQIVTGHSLLNVYQFKCTFLSSPAYGCGDGEESSEHFLFHCSKFTQQRSAFNEICLLFGSNWPPSLADIPRTKQIWDAVCKFVISSGRLHRF